MLRKEILQERYTFWHFLYQEHFLHAINLYNKGRKESALYYRDCISRSNKIFEGVVNSLYLVARKSNLGVRTHSTKVYDLLSELLNKGIIPNIFGNKLHEYRKRIRNPETHEIFQNFGEKKASKALKEALIFLLIGLKCYNLIKNNFSLLNDRNYLHLIVDAFIKSFGLFSEIFALYIVNFQGIYSADIGTLKSLIREFHSNSLFSTELLLKEHLVVQGLRPHFKIKLGNQNLTFYIVKITEYEVMHYPTTRMRLIEKLNNYLGTFNDTYFLVWSFTRRIRKLNLIIEIFKNRGIKFYHLFGLKNYGRNSQQSLF